MSTPATNPPATPPATTPRPTRGPLRRWARRLTLTATLAALLLALGLFLVTRPFLLTLLLRAQLDGYFDTALTLDHAHLAFDGTLTLTGIAVDTPGDDPTFTRLYEADRIVVNLDLRRIIAGQHPIVAVRPVNPRLYITEDLTQGVFNYEMCRLPEAKPGAEPRPLPRLPAIYLSNAQVVLRAIDHDGVKRLETVFLEGELSANTADPNAYGFALRELPDPDDPTPATAVFGQFHTRQLTGNLSVRNFRFNPSQRFLLPTAARDWFDQAAPTGRVPVADITVAPDADGQIAVQSAAFQPDNLTATLLVPGSPLPMIVAGLRGQTRFANDQIQLTNVKATLLGLDITANGSLPLTLDGPGDIRVEIAPFELSWLLRTKIRLFSPDLNTLFDELRPTGRFAVSTRITRTAAGQPLDTATELTLLNAAIRHHEFPYPVLNANGTVRVEDNMVFLDNLTGQSPAGSPITLDGYTDIRPGGPVQINITARGVDNDTHLQRALKPRVRQLVGSFFSALQYDRLLREGVLRHPPIDTRITHYLPPPPTADPSDPDHVGPVFGPAPRPTPPNPNAPLFTLGGRADTDIQVFRNPDSGKVSVRITVAASPGGPGIGFLDQRWPYPVTARSGSLVIAPGEVRLEAIDVVSPTGGTGRVAGRIDLRPAPDHDQIDVRLTPLDLPLDPLFYAAIPEGQRGWVGDLNIRGRIQGDAEIFTRDAGDTDFRIFARLDNVTAAPHEGRFPIRKVHSRFSLTGQRFELREFTGTHDDANIAITGHAAWPSDQNHHTQTTWDFTLDAENIPVTRDLIDLIPPGLNARNDIHDLLDTYHPDGVFDTTIRWAQLNPQLTTPTTANTPNTPNTDPLDNAPPPTVELRPRTLTFDYGGDRLTLTDITGKAVVEPHAVELLDLQGNHPHGTLKLHGSYALQPTHTTRVTLSGHATRIDAFERAVLPPGVTDLIDDALLQGTYRLRSARITATPSTIPGLLDNDGEPARDLHVVTALALNDASLDIGSEITHLQAELNLTLNQPADADYPTLSGSALAPSLRASDRLVERFNARFDTDPQTNRLIIPDFRGVLANGSVVGSAALDLDDTDPNAGYSLKLYINDAAAEPVFDPRVPDPVTNPTPPPLEPYTLTQPIPVERDLANGLISASLTLVGNFDDPLAKTGRGQLSVRDATIYDSPFALAVLQAINLRLPFFAQPFDRAHAKFLVEGQTVWVNHAVLESPSLAIVGLGTMALPDLELNLEMAMQTPDNAQNLTPQLITTIRNQLFGIRVRGTLDDPQATVAPLPNFAKPLPKLPPP